MWWIKRFGGYSSGRLMRIHCIHKDYYELNRINVSYTRKERIVSGSRYVDISFEVPLSHWT